MTGETLKQWTNNIGYRYVRLHKDGKGKVFLVHRLVAIAYIGKPLKQCHEVNHIDGNKENNHVSNLEWITYKRNMQHAHKIGSYSADAYLTSWLNWSPAQLAGFEKSPYNIPACGNYNYPADLKISIDDIAAAEKLAVSF